MQIRKRIIKTMFRFSSFPPPPLSIHVRDVGVECSNHSTPTSLFPFKINALKFNPSGERSRCCVWRKRRGGCLSRPRFQEDGLRTAIEKARIRLRLLKAIRTPTIPPVARGCRASKGRSDPAAEGASGRGGGSSCSACRLYRRPGVLPEPELRQKRVERRDLLGKPMACRRRLLDHRRILLRPLIHLVTRRH